MNNEINNEILEGGISFKHRPNLANISILGMPSGKTFEGKVRSLKGTKKCLKKS